MAAHAATRHPVGRRSFTDTFAISGILFSSIIDARIW
jgi:hypothetical protein